MSFFPPLVIVSLFFFLPTPALSKPLQVLYTNDLHSYLEGSEHPDWGGYAAVKAVIDRLKADARSRGIESVVLDAGDFSEGSQFFFSDRGRQSWRIIDSMGYDAVTVGNHDWLIGASQLEAIFRELNPRTPFLAANLNIDKKFSALRKGIQGFIEFERDGLRIAVLGVTTHELVYRWRMNAGGIDSPVQSVSRWAPVLKSRNDLVIGLTHIGVMEDMALIGKTRGLDVVVGGHSHTKLGLPLMIRNQEQRPVPLVQAGMHGEWVGSLILEVDTLSERPVQVLDSKLIAVKPSQLTSPEDLASSAEISESIVKARTQLEERYTSSWLYEPIGFSPLPLDRPIDSYTPWGNFVLHSIREAAGAEIALDPGEFYGTSQPAGVITNETLMKSYPRVFEVNKPMGWSVWKVKVPGWMLKYVLEYVTQSGLHLNVAGLTFRTESSNGKVKVSGLRVNGNKVNPLRAYTVAVTEGIGRGAVEISILLRLAFAPKDTGIPVWKVLETKLRQSGGHFGDQSHLTPSIGVQ
ncbi:MAG: bifunctional metallophosphatase/5'-nucleotidase [Oligoflexia bacterium]